MNNGITLVIGHVVYSKIKDESLVMMRRTIATVVDEICGHTPHMCIAFADDTRVIDTMLPPVAIHPLTALPTLIERQETRIRLAKEHRQLLMPLVFVVFVQKKTLTALQRLTMIARHINVKVVAVFCTGRHVPIVPPRWCRMHASIIVVMPVTSDAVANGLRMHESWLRHDESKLPFVSTHKSAATVIPVNQMSSSNPIDLRLLSLQTFVNLPTPRMFQ